MVGALEGVWFANAVGVVTLGCGAVEGVVTLGGYVVSGGKTSSRIAVSTVCVVCGTSRSFVSGRLG